MTSISLLIRCLQCGLGTIVERSTTLAVIVPELAGCLDSKARFFSEPALEFVPRVGIRTDRGHVTGAVLRKVRATNFLAEARSLSANRLALGRVRARFTT